MLNSFQAIGDLHHSLVSLRAPERGARPVPNGWVHRHGRRDLPNAHPHDMCFAGARKSCDCTTAISPSCASRIPKNQQQNEDPQSPSHSWICSWVPGAAQCEDSHEFLHFPDIPNTSYKQEWRFTGTQSISRSRPCINKLAFHDFLSD